MNVHFDTAEFDDRLSKRIGKTIIRAPFVQLYHTDTFEIHRCLPYFLDCHSKNLEQLFQPVIVDMFLILIFVYSFIFTSIR